MTWGPLERVFRPGDRVRVRVNLECQYCCDLRFPESAAQAVANDGRLATVYEVGHDDCVIDHEHDEDHEHQAHRVWVHWDALRPDDEPRIRVGSWECPFDQHDAPAELELLEQDDDDDRARWTTLDRLPLLLTTQDHEELLDELERIGSVVGVSTSELAHRALWLGLGQIERAEALVETASRAEEGKA